MESSGTIKIYMVRGRIRLSLPSFHHGSSIRFVFVLMLIANYLSRFVRPGLSVRFVRSGPQGGRPSAHLGLVGPFWPAAVAVLRRTRVRL